LTYALGIAQSDTEIKEQTMARQVSKPNIFWAPAVDTARKIDDSDTVTAIETARYRFSAWPISNVATMKRQAGCAPRSSRKLPRFIKAKPHNHQPLAEFSAGGFSRNLDWRKTHDKINFTGGQCRFACHRSAFPGLRPRDGRRRRRSGAR
jgi:hypothetical protein